MFEGTLLVPSLDDDYANVFNFTSNRTGTLSARIDWTNPGTGIDIFLVLGTCTRADLQAANPGRTEPEDAITGDETFNKPALFTVAITERAYTLAVANYSAVSETVTYRLEIN